jgi:hypothetical protein
VREKRNELLFPSHKKKKKKKENQVKTAIHNFGRNVIRQTTEDIYLRQEIIPTEKMLLPVAKENINFTWQKDVLKTDWLYYLLLFHVSILVFCRSQRPRCLRHELSSPAQTLGSWVRIPIEALMSVCVYSVFMLLFVQVAALRQADPPSKESCRLCTGSRN